MGRLEDRVAIVTGAGRGIGAATARLFAAEGASVVVNDVDEDPAKEVVDSIVAAGGTAVLNADNTVDPEASGRLIGQALSEFGKLDILVNNAQATHPGVLIEDISDEDVELTFGSGFRATLYHIQAAFPHLKERGGSIVNFGSKMGILAGPGAGAYAANKEAIRGLSRVAAKEWGQHKIRVNVINPASLSPGAVAYFEDHPDEVAVHLKDVALGYFGDAEQDIGAAALFLASDDSRYVTGQTINVDGGQVML